MQNTKIINSKIPNLLWLFVFLLFYISADSSLFASGSSTLFGKVFNIFLLSSAATVILLSLTSLPYRYFGTLGVILLSFIITIIVNNSFSGGFILQLSLYIIAIFIVERIPFSKFCAYYEKLVFFFACCSIIFYLFRLLGLNYPGINIVHENNIYYHNFFTSYLTYSSAIIRNFSIFREPGVFAIYLNFAILINILNPQKSSIKLIIFYIALITTLSTTGVIVGILLLILKLNYFGKKSTVLSLLLIGIIIAIIGFDRIFISEYIETTFGKFSVDSDSFNSTLARITSILVPMKIFFENPFGVGFENFTEYYTETSYKLYNIGVSLGMATNTITNMFAKFGFIGIFTLIWVYRLANLFSIRSNSKWLILLVIIMCFFSQDLWASSIFTIFLIYGMKNG